MALTQFTAQEAADYFIVVSKKPDDKSVVVIDVLPESQPTPPKPQPTPPQSVKLPSTPATPVVFHPFGKKNTLGKSAPERSLKEKITGWLGKAGVNSWVTLNHTVGQPLSKAAEAFKNASPRQRKIVVAGFFAVSAFATVMGVSSLLDHAPEAAPLIPGSPGGSGGSGGAIFTGTPTAPAIPDAPAFTPPVVEAPKLHPAAVLDVYSSRTGAGTVEVTAFQQAQQMGIDTSDLTPNQLEMFTNHLRVATLDLNGWTEQDARHLSFGQFFDMLQREQIEEILKSIKN
jgi:hypothetical protein